MLLLLTVDWDTDGESLDDCGLPSKVLVPDFPESCHLGANLIKFEAEEALGDHLSDQFGFCHNGWSIEVLNVQNHTGYVAEVDKRIGIMFCPEIEEV